MSRARSKTPAPVDFGAEPAAAPAPLGEPEILQRLDAPAKWSWALVAGGVVLAAGLSVFAIRGAVKKGERKG
ncbi:MAG: hypothetical protein JSR98_22490 [Proteobacteria bacterium]|nr:hypothetical protein [Pseudomonadota bacterium]